jgi:hypothetical protein
MLQMEGILFVDKNGKKYKVFFAQTFYSQRNDYFDCLKIKSVDWEKKKEEGIEMSLKLYVLIVPFVTFMKRHIVAIKETCFESYSHSKQSKWLMRSTMNFMSNYHGKFYFPKNFFFFIFTKI